MTEAGADIIVCHFGLTTGGGIGAETPLGIDQCVAAGTQWAKAAKEVRKDVIVLAHGGPLAEPADAEYVLRRLCTAESSSSEDEVSVGRWARPRTKPDRSLTVMADHYRK